METTEELLSTIVSTICPTRTPKHDTVADAVVLADVLVILMKLVVKDSAGNAVAAPKAIRLPDDVVDELQEVLADASITVSPLADTEDDGDATIVASVAGAL